MLKPIEGYYKIANKEPRKPFAPKRNIKNAEKFNSSVSTIKSFDSRYSVEDVDTKKILYFETRSAVESYTGISKEQIHRVIKLNLLYKKKYKISRLKKETSKIYTNEKSGRNKSITNTKNVPLKDYAESLGVKLLEDYNEQYIGQEYE